MYDERVCRTFQIVASSVKNRMLLMGKTMDRTSLKSIPLIACLLAALFSCGCTSGNVAAPTEAPLATEIPEVAYENITMIQYWPEDADYSTCDYACTVEKPVFSRAYTAGAAMNAAVENYIEELFTRIEEDYIPGSVAKPPYTQVSSAVQMLGRFTEIVFTEEHCWEAQPYQETYVLILDERGNECGINDIYRTYHAELYIAEALPEALKKLDIPCFEGLDAGLLLPYIDPVHGCVADGECCTVFIEEGAAAPYEFGELAVALPNAALLPAFVGDAITEEEFYSLADMTDLVCSAAVVRGDNIEGGILTQYEATAFMGGAALDMGLVPEKGRLNIAEERFLACYRECFGNEFPGIDTDGFDIKKTEGGYSVSASQKLYEYHLDFISAEFEDGVLTVTADMYYGAYGSAYSVPVAHVVCRAARNGESPYGFTVNDFIMSL